MRRVWPFKPLTPLVESLEWATDVFRAKAGEQRIALRKNPRRVFQMQHFMRDDLASHAATLVRNAQAGDGFWVPDWTQDEAVGAVPSGAGVNIPVDLSNVHYGDNALIWESETLNEVVSVTLGADLITCDVVNDYSSAKIVPVWMGDAPNGLSISRNGANINAASIGFVLFEGYDIGASSYATYQTLDVMDDCPVIASGSFEEASAFSITAMDTPQGPSEYLRSRDLIDHTFQMRWHEFKRSDLFTLRGWLHSRKGRQKSFWFSSYAKDITPTGAISGAVINAFNDVLTRPAPFDIEILDTSGASHYRRVTATAAGTDSGGRPTVDLTIDSTLTATPARISYLRCARFDADRIDLSHNASGGTVVAVPCREVPAP